MYPSKYCIAHISNEHHNDVYHVADILSVCNCTFSHWVIGLFMYLVSVVGWSVWYGGLGSYVGKIGLERYET